MEQQGNHFKADLLDLTVEQSFGCLDQIQSNGMSRDHGVNVNGPNKRSSGIVMMTDEELKIRGELEIDVERDLEEEIKDGICRLALRLHRLYQHQRERSATESSTNDSQSGKKRAVFTEVNITIRMEGGTKIEIKQIKKKSHEKDRHFTSIAKDFNWVRSLRSETKPTALSKKHETSSHVYSNVKHDQKERRNCSSAYGQRKGNVYVGNKKLLELGWKN